MSTLARRASEGERTLLTKRPRGVLLCDEKMARVKFARRAVATEPSAPPPPKRACRGSDVKNRAEGFPVGGKDSVVVHASASERLKRRMEAERDALGILLKKAVILSRDAGKSGKDDARKSIPSVEAAAKVRTTTPSKPAASEMRRQSTDPEKPQAAVQRAAPRTTKGSVASRIDQAKEAMKKRRQEEIARAREKFRQELLELEKAAMPDETIYPEDLEELGITAFQYDVTRTRKQSPLGSR